MTKKLSDLIAEYGANGVIRIDDGNGSAGPVWVDWDEDMEDKLGNIVMSPHQITDRAYEDDDNKDTLGDCKAYVMGDRKAEDCNINYASAWIEDDDRNAPYQATNPYRYRLIF